MHHAAVEHERGAQTDHQQLIVVSAPSTHQRILRCRSAWVTIAAKDQRPA